MNWWYVATNIQLAISNASAFISDLIIRSVLSFQALNEVFKLVSPYRVWVVRRFDATQYKYMYDYF